MGRHMSILCERCMTLECHASLIKTSGKPPFIRHNKHSHQILTAVCSQAHLPFIGRHILCESFMHQENHIYHIYNITRAPCHILTTGCFRAQRLYQLTILLLISLGRSETMCSPCYVRLACNFHFILVNYRTQVSLVRSMGPVLSH